LQDAAFTWEFLHVLSRGQNRAEALWTFEATDSVIGDLELRGAGFGNYSRTAVWGMGAFTSFSGMAVGTLAEPTCISATLCAPAAYWECDDLTTLLTDDPAVMYGTWAMKLNAAASKKYAANANSLFNALPRYFEHAQ
jgi:hypothetical protein